MKKVQLILDLKLTSQLKLLGLGNLGDIKITPISLRINDDIAIALQDAINEADKTDSKPSDGILEVDGLIPGPKVSIFHQTIGRIDIPFEVQLKIIDVDTTNPLTNGTSIISNSTPEVSNSSTPSEVTHN
jgi:hypothetical protein